MRNPLPFAAAIVSIAIACFGETESVRADDKTAAEAGNAVPQGAIAGKVIDGAGKPVAGARVKLYRYHSSKSQRWGRLSFKGETVTTDLSGTYRFPGLASDFFVLSAEKTGLARAIREARFEADESQPFDIVLTPPATPVIRVEDQEGKPVAGARVREFTLRGENGGFSFRQFWLESLGVEIPPSDESGQLRLPSLPSGDVVTVTIDHPSLAPLRTEELKVASGVQATVTMTPGVVVTLHVPAGRPQERIASAVVDLRREPFKDPSTIIMYEARFDTQGIARLTVASGNFSFFYLDHDDYYLTPVYSANHTKKSWLRIEPGRNQDLYFDVHRKVTVRGRVVEAETGKAPPPESSIMGELANGPMRGWDDRPPGEWGFAGWGETDSEGRYAIELASGRARISFQGNSYLAEQEYYELSVAADGSTVIPDIRLRAIPKIAGVVQNPDGSPAVSVVVRLRGRNLATFQPVLTDSAGRFELQPKWVPRDEEAGTLALDQSVVAFDPYRPLAARAAVRLDKSEDVVLKLEPHEADWPLSAFTADFTDWERGIIEPSAAAKNAAVSLRGQAPPEIDGIQWLNTGGNALTLAELRGKFVLLDFWFTGCGPCHGDFPSVKLVHELFEDKGVVVIGVHNNSQSPEAVRKHVAGIGLPFPIVVDHPDGRTVARFQEHGIAGYPNYVLISPEGKVLFDDRTIPSPSLRGYKVEIIRKLLLEAQTAAK